VGPVFPVLPVSPVGPAGPITPFVKNHKDTDTIPVTDPAVHFKFKTSPAVKLKFILFNVVVVPLIFEIDTPVYILFFQT
jgi:hypothetical protein